MLSQCAIYLASSPKSNSAYKAINKSPRNDKRWKDTWYSKTFRFAAYIGYLYPHNYGGYVEQNI